MWIVELALRRPLSVTVMALLMLVLGVLSFAMMNVDIFPAINLPVVLVVYNYPGLSAIDMERRIILISERADSTTVNGIEHIESESFEGIGLKRIYFQPGTDMGAAIAQLNATAGTIATILPRGTEPPEIISYNAANVPVAQLNVFSDTLSGQQLFDYGLNFIRVQLFTIPGFSSPAPLGGVQRTVQVNLDPTALYANGLSPQDVSNAVAAQSVVVPSGQAKMGDRQYNIDINMSPKTVADFNQIPVKFTRDTPVLLGQVAPVSDSHQPQSNVVRIDGKPATYLMVLAGRDLGSTSAAVQRVINGLGKLPPGTKVTIRGQSQAMRQSFTTLGAGIVLAIILVYLLMVANFQSWLEPLIILTAVPGALAGVLWMLALTGTTINVESLMGAIMAVGVGVANGNLLVIFANDLSEEGRDVITAAIEAGATRLRPIMMTALAMVLGMLPMALALGEGSEQSAPLGRAVIGGLLVATMMTLFVVPTVYSIFSGHVKPKRERDAEVAAAKSLRSSSL